jgi:hypothetical protein
MAVPLDAIRAFHNAFRKDMAAMDSAARSAARGRDIPDLVLKRYAFFNEMLAWHANGEEHHVFTALEKVAPLVAEAYQRDHRGLDVLSESLAKAVETTDPMAIALATGEYNFFSTFHLKKEEAHLYRIFNERIPAADQGAIIGKMSQEIPQPRFPEVVTWLYPLIGHDDRENMVRIFQQVLPKPVFMMATGLIRESIGSDWAELTRRVPELKETI